MVVTKSCNTITSEEHLAVDAAGFVWLQGCFDGFSTVMLSHRYVILWEPACHSSSLKERLRKAGHLLLLELAVKAHQIHRKHVQLVNMRKLGWHSLLKASMNVNQFNKNKETSFNHVSRCLCWFISCYVPSMCQNISISIPVFCLPVKDFQMSHDSP